MLKRCGSSLHEGERLIPIEEFGNSISTKDGYSNICRCCTNKSHTNRRHRDASSMKANSKRYYEANKQSYAARKAKSLLTPRGTAVKLLSQARLRALDAGLAFELTLADITIPTTCPVLGIPLVLGARRDQKDYSPSIDRIDSTRGYTKDNVIIVSWRANRIKSDATVVELCQLYEYYKGHTNGNRA